jgi:hypothetical protein
VVGASGCRLGGCRLGQGGKQEGRRPTKRLSGSTVTGSHGWGSTWIAKRTALQPWLSKHITAGRAAKSGKNINHTQSGKQVTNAERGRTITARREEHRPHKERQEHHNMKNAITVRRAARTSITNTQSGKEHQIARRAARTSIHESGRKSSTNAEKNITA